MLLGNKSVILESHPGIATKNHLYLDKSCQPKFKRRGPPIWQPIPIPTLGEKYEASSDGQIRTLHTRGRRPKDGILKGQRHQQNTKRWGKRDRVYVTLTHVTGERKQYSRASLIALTFWGPCPEGKWVCHYDGDPSNDRAHNLRYDTPQRNRVDDLFNNNPTTIRMSEIAETDLLTMSSFDDEV